MWTGMSSFANEPKNSVRQVERQTEQRMCPLFYEFNYHILSKGSTAVAPHNCLLPSPLQPDIILLTMKYKTPHQVGSLLTSKKEQSLTLVLMTDATLSFVYKGGGLFHHFHFETLYSFIIHVIEVLLTPLAITKI